MCFNLIFSTMSCYTSEGKIELFCYLFLLLVLSDVSTDKNPGDAWR